MDRRERIEDMTEAVRAALAGERADIWTAVPGIIQSYNPTLLTCAIQPAQMVYHTIQGVKLPVKLPLLVDCPVQFPSGGGYAMTFPLTLGDEVLVIFASRCIDSWWGSGGVTIPAMHRMHDLSDGFCVPGIFSKPRAVTMVGGASSSAVEIRDLAGTNKVSVTDLSIEVTSDIEVSVTAPIIKLGATGATLQQFVLAAFRTLFNAHTHTAPSGGGVTSAPIVPMDATYLTTNVKGS